MKKTRGLRWGEYRFHALDHENRQRFGQKVWKLSLNGGMTCPNRDGTIGSGGCIFCSEGGSGDFAAQAGLSVTEQINAQKKLFEASGKLPKNGRPLFTAYFQAYTNTYAPVNHLRPLFTEAISCPDVCSLSIATRPDCLGDDVLSLLADLGKEKPVCVELGLQTIHERTARFIRRGYELPCFEQAVKNLRGAGVGIVVHTILGLPGEDDEMILETMRYLNSAGIDGIKLQLLHILEHTDLADLFREDPFPVYTREEYIRLIVRCLEVLSPDLVIHRLTGDGPKDLLIAPLWSANKHTVLNQIRHEMALQDTWQGRCFPS